MAENDARAGAQMNDQVRRMPLYRVLLHDDGLHLARYVAQVLQEVFYFSRRAAEEITSEAICTAWRSAPSRRWSRRTVTPRN